MNIAKVVQYINLKNKKKHPVFQRESWYSAILLSDFVNYICYINYNYKHLD